MTDYELTFITHALEERQIETLLTTFDCISGETHAGEEFVTITADGTDAVSAAKTMHMRLAEHGVIVKRLEPDLVTRREIAERLGVETQAVGNWIRGDRLKGFPKPFHEVANGIWLWGDVVAWSRSVRGIDPADDLQFPTREETDEVNACLQRAYEEAAHSAGFNVFHMRLPVHGEMVYFDSAVEIFEPHPLVSKTWPAKLVHSSYAPERADA